MMKDCHVHTIISHDGISSINNYLRYASLIGVDEITFTEHYTDYTRLNNITNYYQEFINKTEGYKIKTNFGLEIDLNSNINTLLNTFPFDFIIASSHIKNRNMNEKNFNEVLENIKLYNEFDVYSYLDYVFNYNHIKNNEILDEILITLIKKDKGLEINTSDIKYNLGYSHSIIEILKRYKELGGKIVTMGSNAHKVHDLAINFDIALNILQDIGFEEIAVYHKRKPDFIKIRELKK